MADDLEKVDTRESVAQSQSDGWTRRVDQLETWMGNNLPGQFTPAEIAAFNAKLADAKARQTAAGVELAAARVAATKVASL